MGVYGRKNYVSLPCNWLVDYLICVRVEAVNIFE